MRARMKRSASVMSRAAGSGGLRETGAEWEVRKALTARRAEDWAERSVRRAEAGRPPAEEGRPLQRLASESRPPATEAKSK